MNRIMTVLVFSFLALAVACAHADGGHPSATEGHEHIGPPEQIVLVQMQLQFTYDKTHKDVIGYHLVAITVVEDADLQPLGETRFEGQASQIPDSARAAIRVLAKEMSNHISKQALDKPKDLHFKEVEVTEEVAE